MSAHRAELWRFWTHAARNKEKKKQVFRHKSSFRHNSHSLHFSFKHRFLNDGLSLNHVTFNASSIKASFSFWFGFRAGREKRKKRCASLSLPVVFLCVFILFFCPTRIDKKIKEKRKTNNNSKKKIGVWKKRERRLNREKWHTERHVG